MTNSSLISQPIHPSDQDIRQFGINFNHWYVVAQSREIHQKPLGLDLWEKPIILFRDYQGKVHALEDRCPHRQVKLSHGKITDNLLECAYHGWKFNALGNCVEIPYLAPDQKLPTCQLYQYPVKEQDGFIWLFPGEKSRAEKVPLMGVPEWDHLNYIATVSLIDCPAHYSFLIENLMDMYHGHLHQDWQAWADPILQDIRETDHRVDAFYQAQSYYKIDKIWSISQLFFKSLRQLHPQPLNVSYVYPHWVSTLGNDFKIYCLFCPVNLTQTRAYLVHFTSLNAFDKLHKLPQGFRQWIKDLCFGSAQKLLDGLVHQDILMISEEQTAYLQNPHRKNVELNRALLSTQRLIRNQFNQS